MNNNSQSGGSPMTAMLLMGAVILLFMWLNRPKPLDTSLENEFNSTPAAAATTLGADSLTVSQIATIVNTVRQIGQPDSASGSYSLTTPSADLRVSASGQLSGTITDGGAAVEIDRLMTSSHEGLTPARAASAVAALMADIDNAGRYRGFARYLTGDSSTVTLANDLLTVDISNKGGAIARAALRDYKRYDSLAVTPIAAGLDGYSFNITTANQSFPTSEFYFIPTEQTDSSVTMRLDLGNGASWGLRYTLLHGSYCVKMDIVQSGMASILPPSTAEMEFGWHATMLRNEAGRMFEERNSALYYKYAGGGVDNLSENKSARKTINERLSWIGYKNQFFSAILVAQDQFTSAELSSDVLEGDPVALKGMASEATFGYSIAAEVPARFVWYFGPNSYPLMSDLQKEIIDGQDLEFTKVIPLGWPIFRWINTLVIIPVFDFLGKWISNYGIIILLLTIFIKIVLFPFTYKSYMSQAKMRVLTPEINQINEKWPGNENAMKRQQETMALYSRAGASPFSGCLPMLLQMPILIAMFNFFPSAIELRGESFLWAKDLSAPDAIVSWTTNIPLISSTFGNHISLFCLLMTVTNILYTRVTMQSQPSSSSMPGMKWMMYLMPLMFLVFFNNYAAGLSYYYFLSLLITIIQTYVFRRVVKEDKVRAQMKAAAAKPRKKSGFMARLEEAQRRQQQMLREQEKQRKRR